MAPRSVSPPRARILEDLQGRTELATAAQVGQSAGLHHNTAREHLEALVELGLVERHRTQPHGRGRPSWGFQASHIKTEHDPRVREYAGLASALAAFLARSSPNSPDDALVAGRLWGEAISDTRSAATPAAARREVVDALADLGFAPQANQRVTSVALTRCPLLDVAKQYPDVVCSVHLGLVEGALTALGASSTRATLQPFSESGACRLRFFPEGNASSAPQPS